MSKIFKDKYSCLLGVKRFRGTAISSKDVGMRVDQQVVSTPL